MAVLWKNPERFDNMVAMEVWTTCHRIDLKRTWIDLERNSDDLDDLDRVVYAMKEVRRECGTYRYILVMCKCSLLYDYVKSSPDDASYYVDKGHAEESAWCPGPARLAWPLIGARRLFGCGHVAMVALAVLVPGRVLAAPGMPGTPDTHAHTVLLVGGLPGPCQHAPEAPGVVVRLEETRTELF